MSIVIDRRLNDRNKSAVNRARFIRRYKEQIQRAVGDLAAKRGITDMEQGGDVSIPSRDIREPTIHHGPGGDQEYVHPGNHSFNAGDRLPRPQGQGSGGGGSGEGDGSGSEDNFIFTLSREEFMNLFFDDLELPHLVRNFLGEVRDFKMQRAGYTPSGVPANLSVPRSLRNATARRIALSAPLRRQIAELEAQEEREDDLVRRAEIEEQIALLRGRIDRVPFLDDIDLRFRHRVKVPQPISRAVMFCLMDVSASMTEDKKDLAKRFFTLLYLFLSRKYEKVEVVFIRHTDNAEEVDEQRFFHDTQSGGTVVQSALRLMHEIAVERYPSQAWNIYGAQVSDGDAFGADPEKSRAWLAEQLLPLCRYYAYIEVPDDEDHTSPLSYAYARIESPRFAMKSVTSRAGVYPVLRDLFKREAAV
ncbi:YeaH/YhbH family protein [Panacagrimonas sp.]|uniref:YeaH/YhbH family protein n=1 Tax=Panacagrimonas sp. TaxID=2480088 RepID=UPI003B521A11